MITLTSARTARAAGTLVALLVSAGCAATAERSSPWELGLGARIAPRMSETASGLTLHPMAGYTYFSFDGGHDGVWDLGGQVRKPLPSVTSRPGLWVGGEGALSIIRETLDIAGFSGENDTGFEIAALAGFPVGQSRWGWNVYGSAGLGFHYGGTGINLRLGVDLQPWFLDR